MKKTLKIITQYYLEIAIVLFLLARLLEIFRDSSVIAHFYEFRMIASIVLSSLNLAFLLFLIMMKPSWRDELAVKTNKPFLWTMLVLVAGAGAVFPTTVLIMKGAGSFTGDKSAAYDYFFAAIREMGAYYSLHVPYIATLLVPITVYFSTVGAKAFTKRQIVATHVTALVVCLVILVSIWVLYIRTAVEVDAGHLVTIQNPYSYQYSTRGGFGEALYSLPWYCEERFGHETYYYVFYLSHAGVYHDTSHLYVLMPFELAALRATCVLLGVLMVQCGVKLWKRRRAFSIYSIVTGGTAIAGSVVFWYWFPSHFSPLDRSYAWNVFPVYVLPLLIYACLFSVLFLVFVVLMFRSLPKVHAYRRMCLALGKKNLYRNYMSLNEGADEEIKAQIQTEYDEYLSLMEQKAEEERRQLATNNVTLGESQFDGTFWQYVGWNILGKLITSITLGICYPVSVCYMESWKTRHTIVRGRRLVFDGKPSQLFGHWLLWMLLIVITVGIFGLFVPVRVRKWVVLHTHFADSNEDAAPSKFTGSALGYTGMKLLTGLISAITLRLLAPTAQTMMMRWEMKNTHIDGMRLKFNGNGLQLLGKWILWTLLGLLTLGIYLLFRNIKLLKWKTSHIVYSFEK